MGGIRRIVDFIYLFEYMIKEVQAVRWLQSEEEVHLLHSFSVHSPKAVMWICILPEIFLSYTIVYQIMYGKKSLLIV